MSRRGSGKSYELSEAAVHTLNETQEDYGFTDGPQFLDDVLDVRGQLRDLTPDQVKLRQELAAMPAAARASLSRAIRAAWRRTPSD